MKARVRTVLLVDDNGVSRRLARDGLALKGFAVRQVDSGRDAIAALTRARPDVMVLDIQMPRMSGLEVLAWVRQSPDPAVRSVRIIAATALAMEGDAERCLQAGADDYLSRPFRLRELVERIDRLMPPSDTPGV